MTQTLVEKYSLDPYLTPAQQVPGGQADQFSMEWGLEADLRAIDDSLDLGIEEAAGHIERRALLSSAYPRIDPSFLRMSKKHGVDLRNGGHLSMNLPAFAVYTPSKGKCKVKVGICPYNNRLLSRRTGAELFHINFPISYPVGLRDPMGEAISIDGADNVSETTVLNLESTFTGIIPPEIRAKLGEYSRIFSGNEKPLRNL